MRLVAHHPVIHSPKVSPPTLDARMQMIVADTGNNRLQVFHVDIFAGPRGDPGLHAASERSSSSGSRRTFDGLLPSNAIRGTPAAEAVGVVGDGSSRDCLIVFAGGEGVGMLRKRRTAGESEAAEGPLCQPCDLAYWRARPPGRGIDGNTSTWAWTSELPRWFRRHTSHGSLGLPYPDADGEEEAKRELLPPDFTNNIPIPSPGGDENGNEDYSRSGNETTAGLARSFVRGAAGGRRPLLGAFLVRETGIYGKLQLLFVAKTKVRVVFLRDRRQIQDVLGGQGLAAPRYGRGSFSFPRACVFLCSGP